MLGRLGKKKVKKTHFKIVLICNNTNYKYINKYETMIFKQERK